MWVGGYPRWKNVKRAVYIEEMKNQISKTLIFKGGKSESGIIQ